MPETPAPTPPAAPAQPDYALDYSRMSEAYANFCRVAQTPEELVLDFGLNPQMAPTSEPIKITHRLILNYYTAKRLLLALNQFIQRHEATFGVLELDFNKRVRGPRQG
ncbi:MAG TPA: DUF3467 domain-containing protein [Gemmataceae bacterium]|nr:DUF3467 domain-containing protein [Gemmataceae bacterium]